MSNDRGILTEDTKNKAKELFGRDITIIELRLIPYFNYCLVNSGILDISKINGKEMEILGLWVDEGRVTEGLTNEGRPKLSGERLDVTKEFWDAMNELLWISYV